MRFPIFKDFFELIFPTNCCHCSRSLFAWEQALCTICKNKLPLTNYHLRPSANDLTQKLQGLITVDYCLAFLKFTRKGMTQNLLHTLKYRNKPELGFVLGKIYGELLYKHEFAPTWNLIVPVPLHAQKLKRRGFNQSEEFAKGLAYSLKIPVENLLIRKQWTDTQTKKSRIERLQNVEDVFELDPRFTVSNQSILVVDDVITTGATLIACGNTLLDSGVKKVDLATIAAGGKY